MYQETNTQTTVNANEANIAAAPKTSRSGISKNKKAFEQEMIQLIEITANALLSLSPTKQQETLAQLSAAAKADPVAGDCLLQIKAYLKARLREANSQRKSN